ncbi:LCP family protein [Tessaracoccus flavus]|uniref:Uncharacterized protein n=1 Tax=Tessaracoccus flavus TaxID=1610493 RepID=A0A1Q2CHA3_9ACTN|nr:LCP family protein [Tessaracoccus flavus]AQP45487.1 hypothetical protein RPIT_12310 [Tessaracoccus flavus]SDY90971.1 transcriptional attenuator, LytR family [Tessaracoccus flavus]
MSNEGTPRRNADGEEAVFGATPSRAFEPEPPADDGLPDDMADTVRRPAFNADWYRSGDQRATASVSPEEPWVADLPSGDDPHIGGRIGSNPSTSSGTTGNPSTSSGTTGNPSTSSGPSGRKLRTAFLLTAASTILPGSGLLGAPRLAHKAVGALSSLTAIIAAAVLYSRYSANPGRFIARFTDPSVLQTTMLTMIVIGLVWAMLIAATNIVTRPAGLSVGKRALSAALVTALAFGVTAPSALAARYSRDTTLAIEKVAPTGEKEVVSTSRPTLEDHDPWAKIPRLNILLLGADGSEARADVVATDSVRTDTIMVASIDTHTGDTTLVQVPRNVQYTPFPEGSEMDEAFPDGFSYPGEGDRGAWMVNGIWGTVELYHEELFSGSTYRGAEALKEGIQGITGLKIDYFAMLNIDGLQELIDAMGGVTLNVNDRYPMGVDRNPPWSEPSMGWLEKGPDQRLDGFEAMWFARSRSRHDDYDRMARQSCLIGAVIDQANPTNLLQRFEAVAAASSDMIVTDIPQRDFPEMVELAFRVKDGDVNRLVFVDGKNGYEYNDPDFEAMRQAVEEAIEGPSATPTPSVSPSPSTSVSPTATDPGSPSASPSPSETPFVTEGSQDVTDACAYRGD